MSPRNADESGVNDRVIPASQVWHDNLIRQLVTLKQQQRLPHAIMIELRTSVDSTPLGWRLVQALLCSATATDGRPCGSCDSCGLMQANSYPDFTYTTLVENDRTHKLNRDIKTEQIRALIHQLSLTPNLQAGKFALIYPAERMNPSSANSLLKTLEEPAANSTLLLLTHHAARLPVTIRSRCQRWVVDNPARPQAGSWLAEQGLESDEIDDYLELTHGDAELALQLQRHGVMQHLQAFRDQVKQYLGDKISAPVASAQLRQQPDNIVRLVVGNVLTALVHQQLQREFDHGTKLRLRGLLDLVRDSGQMLNNKENNLILQLQLEDVLISLKQILMQGRTHASSTG